MKWPWVRRIYLDHQILISEIWKEVAQERIKLADQLFKDLHIKSLKIMELQNQLDEVIEKDFSYKQL